MMYSISFNERTRTWLKHSRNRSGILIVRGRLVQGRRNGSVLVFFIRKLGRMEGFMSSIYHPSPLLSHPFFVSFSFFLYATLPFPPPQQRELAFPRTVTSLGSPAPLLNSLHFSPFPPQQWKRKLTNIKKTSDGTHTTSSPSPAFPTQTPPSPTPNP